jgi:hypothetical protein
MKIYKHINISIFATALTLVIGLTVGCSTLHTVNISSRAIETAIQPGDRVVVETLNNGTAEFTVTAVSAEELQGNRYTIPVSDIAKLQLKRADKNKTIWLTIAIIAIGAAAAGGGGGGGY